ncbi:unnamed protein product, partial [Gulo gulo]
DSLSDRPQLGAPVSGGAPQRGRGQGPTGGSGVLARHTGARVMALPLQAQRIGCWARRPAHVVRARQHAGHHAQLRDPGHVPALRGRRVPVRALQHPGGLRRLHLRLLRGGDDHQDGGPGALRAEMLPGGHVEQAGLLHRRGRHDGVLAGWAQREPLGHPDGARAAAPPRHQPCAQHADPGHAAAGHTAHARERPSALLLRLLHLRHRGRPAVGWPAAQPLLPGQHLCQKQQPHLPAAVLPDGGGRGEPVHLLLSPRQRHAEVLAHPQPPGAARGVHAGLGGLRAAAARGRGRCRPQRLHQLEPVLQRVPLGRFQPPQRRHQLRQHRLRVDRHLPG